MNNLFLDYKLSSNSWFGLGGKAKKFFTPDTEEELINYLKNIQLDNFITIGLVQIFYFVIKVVQIPLLSLVRILEKLTLLMTLLFVDQAF